MATQFVKLYCKRFFFASAAFLGTMLLVLTLDYPWPLME